MKIIKLKLNYTQEQKAQQTSTSELPGKKIERGAKTDKDIIAGMVKGLETLTKIKAVFRAICRLCCTICGLPVCAASPHNL